MMFVKLASLNGTKSLELSENHIQFWQTARDYTVGGDNISSNLIIKTVEGPVNLILGIGLVILMTQLIYTLGFKTAKGGVADVFIDNAKQGFWVFLVVFLLANQYARAYDFVEGIWEFRNGMRNNTATIVMANEVFNDAIANEVFNVQFGQKVSERLAVCQSLPFPTVRVPQAKRPTGAVEVKLEQGQTYDFLSCLETLEKEVKQDQLTLQRACGEKYTNCEVIEQKASDLAKQVGDGVKTIRQKLITTIPSGGIPGLGGIPEPLAIQADFSFLGDAISGALSGIGDWVYMELAEGINTFYTTFIEISFLLAGLFFPITVAWSWIPGKRQVMGDWGVGMLALVITEQIYLIIVGITAVMSTLPQFQEFGSRLFLFTFGISAPILAMGSGGISGLALARTFRGVATGAAAAAGGIIGGAVATAAYRQNTRRQLAR